MQADVIIRGGEIADGRGGPLYEGDVAIQDGRVVALGKISDAGKQEIDARGKIVTPGFVDIHTHYDGHATWASRLAPSSAHGVTTVLTGNCGVGFAPCRPEDRDRLIRLMEGVEDLPGAVLHDGLPWNWQSFPEYLDTLQDRRFDMDLAMQVPHAPLRVFVMGERGANREPATAQDIRKMGVLAREAIEHGALGFSTSRALAHRGSDGAPIPTLTAGADELVGIASAIGQAGQGVIEAISDFGDLDGEFNILRDMARVSGRPLSLSLMQRDNAPTRWRAILSKIEEANRNGLMMRGQVFGRPIGLLMGIELSSNPFSQCPTYLEHINASMAFSQRLDVLRQPDIRARLICELNDPSTPRLTKLERIFPFTEPLNYEPAYAESVAALAAERGLDAAAYVYDLLVAGDGRTILYAPMSNYHDGTLEAALEMMRSEHTVLGLGDGGAHCGLICDASYPTTMLTHWGRDRKGERLPLPQIVRALSRDTAQAVGLADRGEIALGYRADINVIDFDRLRLRGPQMIYDLPGGGGRLGQEAEGYVATLVAGQITAHEGVPTRALPGRLVRGAQAAPTN